MKKGISLIVLVITILVLAILAGAVIISLSNTNVIEQASEATREANLANAKNAVTLEYAAAVARGTVKDGRAYQEDGETLMDEDAYEDALTAAGFTASDFVVSIVNGVPKVELAAAQELE